MNKRISALIVSIIVLVMASFAMAGIFTIVRANSTIFIGPPAKQTAEAQQTARAATAQAGSHAPKPTSQSPAATEPASCPHAGPGITYVGPVGPNTGAPPFFASEVMITSEAIVTVGGNYYSIWLGAPGDHLDQGLIRVLEDSADPCASRRLGTTTPTAMADYTTPKGPLTAVKIEGNILFYTVAGGGMGSFDFVARQFLPSSNK